MSSNSDLLLLHARPLTGVTEDKKDTSLLMCVKKGFMGSRKVDAYAYLHVNYTNRFPSKRVTHSGKQAPSTGTHTRTAITYQHSHTLVYTFPQREGDSVLERLR